MYRLHFLRKVYKRPFFYIALVVVLVGGCKTSTFDESDVNNSEPKSFEDMAYLVAQDTVIKKLRDPLNATFAVKPDRIENSNGKDFTIFSQVRADNGEEISDMNFVCRVEFKGGEYNKPANWKLLYLEMK